MFVGARSCTYYIKIKKRALNFDARFLFYTNTNRGYSFTMHLVTMPFSVMTRVK